jgi:hypothetical protein
VKAASFYLIDAHAGLAWPEDQNNCKLSLEFYVSLDIPKCPMKMVQNGSYTPNPGRMSTQKSAPPDDCSQPRSKLGPLLKSIVLM